MTPAIYGQPWWRIHLLVYLIVVALLFLWAVPVNWDTPTNLGAYDGWAPLTGFVAIVALALGLIQRLLLARGVQIGALLACVFSAAFVFMCMGIFLDGPISNGDEVWTAGREQVVVPQLLWAWYWLVHSSVVTLWPRRQGNAQPVPSRTDGSLHSHEGTK